MRVRYGKPIRVKSILGKCNVPFSHTAANVTFYPLTTGTFHYYAGPSVLNIKYVNRQANHKYFLFLNTDIVYSWSYFGIWDTYNTGYEGNRTAPTKDGNNYYALISPTTSATNGVPSFQFGVTQNLPAIANYALIIDLTEIGLDNLTAQEFYNKYNKYFPLIATGEEITIDDKAGQVSLKEKNSNNTISCKVAGGSSDIYYGYNQLIRSGDFTDMSEWTSYNCNIETVEDGYIKLTTTATNGRILQYPNHGGYTLRTDHLYLIHLDVKDIDGKFSMVGFEYLELSTGINYLIKHGNGKTLINIYGGYDRVGTYIIMKNLFIIDLTEWYGAGKEPTTAQEFYSKFTKSLYGDCISPIKLTRYQIEALPNYGYNQMTNRLNSSSDSGFT